MVQLTLSLLFCPWYSVKKAEGKMKKNINHKFNLTRICDNFCNDNDFVPVDLSAPVF